MIRSIIFFIIGSLILNCSGSKELKMQEKREPVRPEVRALMNKKNDTSIFWGEAIATIENKDLGKARELAKKRALADLSRKIRVNVEADISSVIQSNMTGATEDIRDFFSEKVRTYTQSLLTNTKDLFIVDYPKEGNCTFFVYMSKAEYQQKVNADLKMKKAAIRSAVESGDEAMRRNEFMIASNQWANAAEQLQRFFGELPLQDDLDKNGKIEEVHSYLLQQMSRLYGNIELSFINDQITYDANGLLTRKPIVQAKYKDLNGSFIPVGNLPLMVEFVNGRGKVNGDMITSTYGECELNLKIDASNPQTMIAVRINKSAINGLDAFPLPHLSEARMTLNKIKTVAVSVLFDNQGVRSTPNDMLTDVKNLLLGKECTAVDFKTTGLQVTRSDLNNASDTNADYLLVVSLKASKGSTVGGYANMYVANASGFISLYKLPRGNQIATDRIASVRGFGVSASVAGWDAMGKIRKSAMTKIRQIVERSL